MSNTDTQSDAILIARVLSQNDQHAFRQLVLRYQSPVRRWARRLCKDDAAAADDLSQEVFIRAYRSLHGFRGRARFSTWLYRITFNLAASQKRLSRDAWHNLDLSDTGESEWDPAVDQTESGNADIQRDLEQAMARLKQAEQWALRLSLEEGMSHEEVAEVTGIPLGTVKTHLLRGKQQLRKTLAHWRETV